MVPEKIFLNLDNRKYFGGCHAPGHHKRNILNFINASHSLVLLYPKNILANIYENPTTLITLLINLSIDNPQKKNKPWVFGLQRNFQIFTPSLRGFKCSHATNKWNAPLNPPDKELLWNLPERSYSKMRKTNFLGIKLNPKCMGKTEGKVGKAS